MPTLHNIPPSPPLLEPGHLHVWRLRPTLPADTLQSLQDLLSSEEQSKAARFRFASDRIRYITARAGLRNILAGYLGCKPCDVIIQPGALGKPMLSGPGRSASIGFNLSHSGDLSLLAVGRAEHIGVDIEEPRALADLMEVAKTVLTDAEMHVLQAREPQDRNQCFLEMWTRKEAVVKAAGLGIGVALNCIDMEPADPAGSWNFKVTGGLEGMPPLFGRRFTPDQGYYAAVVCEENPIQVIMLDWPEPQR